MHLKNGATTMITTDQFLDLCKEKLGSDYKTSLALGKDDSFVSRTRKRGGVLSDEIGLQIAQILDFPDDWMILCLAAERAMKSGSFDVIDRLKKAADAHTPPQFPQQGELPLKTGTDTP